MGAALCASATKAVSDVIAIRMIGELSGAIIARRMARRGGLHMATKARRPIEPFVFLDLKSSSL
jgi:hypothetical protein